MTTYNGAVLVATVTCMQCAFCAIRNLRGVMWQYKEEMRQYKEEMRQYKEKMTRSKVVGRRSR